MKIGLVILNRNEEEALPTILPSLPQDAIELLFAVDGGSTDRSLEILKAHHIEVVPQTSPGRGEAFRLAVDYARNKVDALIFFSPDGNEDPADIPRFRPMLESGSDMVVASRMMEGAYNEEDDTWFRPRKWANLAFREIAHLSFGRGQPKITDPINGYRAFTLRAWDEIKPDGEGYTIEYQSSIRAYQRGLRVAEFPTREGQRIGGQSGAGSIPTGLRFVRLYLRECLKSV